MTQRALLFPGQGSQMVGMGRDFFESSSLARDVFAQADEGLGFKISALCFDGPEEELKLTQNTQPALLVVSYIAYLLYGKNPVLAAGHSLGEYTALVAAGSLGFIEALSVVRKRGQYMQEAVPVGAGAMAAILGLDYENVERRLTEVEEGVVEIANWNSPEQVVIAGHEYAVRKALDLIKPPRSVMLPVSAPFHCELMKSAEEKLSVELDRLEFLDLAFPVVTNVEARIIQKGEEARDALKKQVSRPVLWYKSMEVMRKEGIDVFIEMGPGMVLSRLVKRISRGWDRTVAVLNIENMESLKETHKILS